MYLSSIHLAAIKKTANFLGISNKTERKRTDRADKSSGCVWYSLIYFIFFRLEFLKLLLGRETASV